MSYMSILLTFSWFIQYEDTVDERNTAAHETTAAILADFITLLDDDDLVFFAKLFVIIFDFSYLDIQSQDTRAQTQTLVNCKPYSIIIINISFLTVSSIANTFYSTTSASFFQTTRSKVSKVLGSWVTV